MLASSLTSGDLVIFGAIFAVMALVFFGLYMLLFGGENPDWPRRIFTLLVVVLGLGLVGAIVG